MIDTTGNIKNVDLLPKPSIAPNKLFCRTQANSPTSEYRFLLYRPLQILSKRDK